MYKKLRKYFHPIFRPLIISFLAIVAIILAYLFYAISQAQDALNELQVAQNIQVQEKVKLEQGSFVQYDHLQKYYLISKNKGKFKEWIEQNLENQKIAIQKNRIAILEDIELAPIQNNTCKRLNCLQYKVAFDEISPSLWKGLMGIEDFRFLEHEGVDLISIMRAIVVDLKEMKLVQGGSTLTQQLVKNIFLTNEKKIERKIREIIYAIYLEKKLTKEQIITSYFNEVFWGTHQGIYLKGVGAASLAYFGKKPNELNTNEANILISLLKGPYFYHPIKHFDRLKERVEVVSLRLKSLSLLDDEIEWNNKQWNLWHKNLEESSKSSYLNSFYLINDEKNQYWNSFEKFVFYQSVAKIKENISLKYPKIDFALKSIAISKNCEAMDCDRVFSFYSKLERKKDEAIQNEKHQVGSVLKPIVYEQFIELGKKLDDLVDTMPITLKLKSGEWTPKDSVKNPEDKMTLLQALQKSKNIPLIRLAHELGFENVEQKLLPYLPNLLRPLSEFPAQLLGATELSLSELAFIYLKYIKNTCENIKQNKYLLEDSILYLMSDARQTTISKVANDLIKDLNIFGKTGTSNNGLDNWYVAFDGEQVYITWFGVDSERTNKDIKLSGASSAFKVFQEFILYRGKRVSELYCL